MSILSDVKPETKVFIRNLDEWGEKLVIKDGFDYSEASDGLIENIIKANIDQINGDYEYIIIQGCINNSGFVTLDREPYSEVIYHHTWMDKILHQMNPIRTLKQLKDKFVLNNSHQNIHFKPNEGATTYNDNLEPISKFIPGKSEHYIDIPDDDVNAVKKSYFGIVGHSHTKSRIPLPSCNDIKVGMLNLNVKYNIIYAPGYGITIIKKNNPKSKPNKEELKAAFKRAKKKRNKYVEANTVKNTEEYKKKVNYGRDVSSIEYSNNLENIVDDTKHSNLNEQCNFYNDELTQFGIELMYITP